MNRRTFLKRTGLASAALTFGGLSSASGAESNAKPNLIYIFADQLGTNHCGYAKYWNGQNYPGAENAITPNIDNFAAQSVNFKNCVSNTPVCSAYRASLFTGKYITTLGVVINELRMNPYHECIGHVLTRASYNTSYIGKWHLYANELGNHYDPKNSYIPRGIHRLGFNGYWAAYNFHHDYYGENAYYHTESEEKVHYDNNAYEPDAQTDMAINWLKCRAGKSSRPFAMFLSYGTPHAPWNTGNVPEEYMDMYADKSMPNPPNYKPENDEPYSDAWSDMSDASRASLQQTRRIYYAMTANLDWNFGRIMQYLEESGLSENTIVVFASDHGEMFGSQGRAAKNIFYEEAARVPFIVRWPGHTPAGEVKDTCISTVDFMPTLLGMMGLDKPPRVEGDDLSHIALGQSGPEPEFAFLQNTGACASWENGHEWRAIRGKQFTYARYLVDGAELLFDNINDPFQQNNLAADITYSSTLQQMRDKMSAKMTSISDEDKLSTWYRDNWTDGNRVILRGARG